MYINTNVAALNSELNLQNTQNSMNQVLQQLSSGYQINSAADNPAGLAISEQMQSQINGMAQAYQNSQSGISMLQTADGALGQIQNILQSMYSLSTQSANDTNVGVDRASLQSEMNQYTAEINSIVNQTAFNNKNLLGGTLQAINLAIGADPNQELQVGFQATDAVSLGVAGNSPTAASFVSSTSASTDGLTGLTLFGANSSTNPYGSYGLQATNTSGTPTGQYQIQMTAASLAQVNGDALYSGNTATITPSTDNAGTSLAAGEVGYSGSTTQSIEVEATTSSTSNSSGKYPVASVEFSTNGGQTWTTATTNSSEFILGSTGVTLGSASTSAFTSSTTASATDTYNLNLTPASTSFQLLNNNGNVIGAAQTVYGEANQAQAVTIGDANDGQAIQVNYNPYTFLGSVSSSSVTLPSSPFSFNVTYTANQAATGSNGTLTSKASVGGGLSIMNYQQASSTQQSLQAALNQISAERANVGAWQNRLQFASSDLQTSQQNLTTAQAGIMDANVASDTAQLAKYQVLQQSGVAMLAQAEQIPQALLKLLP